MRCPFLRAQRVARYMENADAVPNCVPGKARSFESIATGGTTFVAWGDHFTACHVEVRAERKAKLAAGEGTNAIEIRKGARKRRTAPHAATRRSWEWTPTLRQRSARGGARRTRAATHFRTAWEMGTA